MTSIEISAAFGSCLLAMAAAAYLLHRQCITIDKQAKALDAYNHALDDERKAHAKTNARLIEEQRLHKDACL